MRLPRRVIAERANQPEINAQHCLRVQHSSPQFNYDLDRTRESSSASILPDCFNTLQIYLGSLYGSMTSTFGPHFLVTLQAATRRRGASASDLSRLSCARPARHVTSCARLGSLRSDRRPGDPCRTTTTTSALINGSAAAGYSSGQAFAACSGPRKRSCRGTRLRMDRHHLPELKSRRLDRDDRFALAILFVFSSWRRNTRLVDAVSWSCSRAARAVGALLALWLRGRRIRRLCRRSASWMHRLAAKNAILISSSPGGGAGGPSTSVEAAMDGCAPCGCGRS